MFLNHNTYPYFRERQQINTTKLNTSSIQQINTTNKYKNYRLSIINFRHSGRDMGQWPRVAPLQIAWHVRRWGVTEMPAFSHARAVAARLARTSNPSAEGGHQLGFLPKAASVAPVSVGSILSSNCQTSNEMIFSIALVLMRILH